MSSTAVTASGSGSDATTDLVATRCPRGMRSALDKRIPDAFLCVKKLLCQLCHFSVADEDMVTVGRFC